MRFFSHRAILGVLVLIPLTFAGSVVAAGPSRVDLGTADSYGVLAGDTITNTGATTINGDLGLYPGTSVTGSPTVNGASNVNNSAAQIAKADLRTAYLNAEGRSGAVLIAAGALGGRTLAPGLYKDDGAPASLGIASGQTLTLAGDASSVWIFQSASTLIAESGSRVVLSGGAQSCNVFWQVGSSATLRTGSTFVGTVMAHVDISVENSVTVAGRLLAGAQASGAGALTMNTDTISKPTCLTAAEVAAAAAAAAATPAATADVGVVKTASAGSVALGDNVTYTSVVTNHGPGVATSVAFSDALPAGMAFASVTTTQGSCSGTTTVTCAIGTLGVGSTATVVIVAKSTAAGTITNTAGIGARQADHNVGANNTSAATVRVVAPVVTPAPAPVTPPPARPTTPTPKATAAAKAAAARKAALAKAAAAAAAGASTSVAGPALPPVNPAGFTG